jgi:serine/threonine protein kinase
MLAESLDGGAALYYCLDPASNKTVRLHLVPVPYPDDEGELRRLVDLLLTYRCGSVERIVDFSVHVIKSFNSKGFTALSQKVGLVLSEYYDGISLEEHVYRKWQVLSDRDFRQVVVLAARGLLQLHDLGVLHRNLHPGFCVVIEQSDGSLGCVVEDMWFLHNPRPPGCTYSCARADWGAAEFAPPEVAEGSVSDRSDVFAFGLCVYSWATVGTKSMRVSPANRDVAAMLRSLPSRWGPWVVDLLNACLQRQPQSRPSTAELVRLITRS